MWNYEAIDHELVTEREGKKEIPGLGKTVNFKVVEAFSHHRELRTYGIESRYWIRVESEELDKIRMDLTGLPRPELGFCINVGVRLDREKSITGKETPAPTFMIKSNHLLWAIIVINTATLSMMSSYAFNYFMN